MATRKSKSFKKKQPKGLAALGLGLYNRWAEQGKKWDTYQAISPSTPSERFSLTVIESFTYNLFTYYKIQVTDLGTKETIVLDRSGVSLYRLYRSLSLDLRFFPKPCVTQPRAEKELVWRDFLAFLCARNLNNTDRQLVQVFIDKKDAEAELETRAGGRRSTEQQQSYAEQLEDEDENKGADEVIQVELEVAEDDDEQEVIERMLTNRDRSIDSELKFISADSRLSVTSEDGEDEQPLFHIPDTSNPAGVRRVEDFPYREIGPEEQSKCDHESEVEQGKGTEAEQQLLQRWGNSVRGKNLLDIYIPRDDALGKDLHEVGGKPLPVMIHMHGGGWVRGDRKDAFRGAPSFCIAYAHMGFVAVAPSYRLSDAPNHMLDCREAVGWVLKNISKYGGDPSCVFLSGHSAGGNIASMLAVSNEFGLLPNSAIKGVVCVSGVYNLFRPMPSFLKNLVFTRMYLVATFGKGKLPSSALLLRNSPSEILRCKVDKHPVLNKQRKKRICKSSQDEVVEINKFRKEQKIVLPPFLILSASWDLGLEYDAVNFSILLRRYGVDVCYEGIPSSTHVDICWSEAAHAKIQHWLELQLTAPAAEPASSESSAGSGNSASTDASRSEGQANSTSESNSTV